MMQVLPTYGTARSWIDTANSCFIQWGNGKTSKLIGEVAFPIDYSNPLAAVPYDITGKGGIAYVAAIVSINNTGFTVTTDSNNESLGAFGWISVGF